MKSLKLLTILSVVALAPATGAFAQGNNTPANPNCTQGVRGCENYYATTDHSDQFPTNSANGAALAPNCAQGQAGCQNYPTDHLSDTNPLKSGTQH